MLPSLLTYILMSCLKRHSLLLSSIIDGNTDYCVHGYTVLLSNRDSVCGFLSASQPMKLSKRGLLLKERICS